MEGHPFRTKKNSKFKLMIHEVQTEECRVAHDFEDPWPVDIQVSQVPVVLKWTTGPLPCCYLLEEFMMLKSKPNINWEHFESQ